MNPEFKKWLEEQTYKYVMQKQTGVWKVTKEKYNELENFNWGHVLNRYKILERIRQSEQKYYSKVERVLQENHMDAGWMIGRSSRENK